MHVHGFQHKCVETCPFHTHPRTKHIPLHPFHPFHPFTPSTLPFLLTWSRRMISTMGLMPLAAANSSMDIMSARPPHNGPRHLALPKHHVLQHQQPSRSHSATLFSIGTGKAADDAEQGHVWGLVQQCLTASAHALHKQGSLALD